MRETKGENGCCCLSLNCSDNENRMEAGTLVLSFLAGCLCLRACTLIMCIQS